MAKIVEYNAPEQDTELRPNETGAEAIARSGRIIEAQYNKGGQELGSAVGGALGTIGAQVVQHASQMGVSNAAAKFIPLTDQLNTSWQDTLAKADPNNIPEARQAFLDARVKPAMDDWINQSGWTDQERQYRQGQADRFMQHMTEQTGASMVNAAGHALVANTAALKDQGSAAVYNNPGSLDFHLNEVDPAIDNAAGAIKGLSGDQVQDAKSQISLATKKSLVSSAFYSIAQNQGTAAAKAFAANPKYAALLDGQEAGRYIKMAETQERSLAVAQRSLALSEQRQAAEQASNQYVGKLYDPNLSAADVQKMLPEAVRVGGMAGQGFGATNALSRITLQRAEELNTGKTVVDNPSVVGQFQTQVGTQDFDPRAAYQAFTSGQMPYATYQRLISDNRQIVDDPNMQQAVKQLDDVIKSFGPAYGGGILGQFTKPEDSIAFSMASTRMKQAGIDYLKNGGKVQDLLNPSNANYIGKYVNHDADVQAAQQYTGSGPPVVPFGQGATGTTSVLPPGTLSFKDWQNSELTANLPKNLSGPDMAAAYASYLHSRGQK